VKECDEFVPHIWNSWWGEFKTNKYYRELMVKGWNEFVTHIWSSKWGEFETHIYETRMPPSSTIETYWCTACYTLRYTHCDQPKREFDAGGTID